MTVIRDNPNVSDNALWGWGYRLAMIGGRLSALCLVCAITLLFGLWPLDFRPDNQVGWLGSENGIQFHKHGVSSQSCRPGIVYSPNQVDIPSVASGYHPATIELWVEPKSSGGDGLGYILSFYDGRSQEPLIVGQWRSELVVRSRTDKTDSHRKYWEIDLRDGLRDGVRSLITVASGVESTEIYVNGEPAKSLSSASFFGLKQIVGRLVLGNSATGASPWMGNVYGVAIYDRNLSPGEVRQNYKEWAGAVNGPTDAENGPVIMYAFDERDGSCVRNLVEDKNHLVIPSTFTALKRNMLTPIWADFEFTGWGLVDVFINVFGFVPFGFCMAGYLAKGRGLERGWAYAVTMLSGFCLSLIIEMTQTYLPVRCSSFLDLACNTFGTILGVLVVAGLGNYRRLPGLDYSEE